MPLQSFGESFYLGRASNTFRDSAQLSLKFGWYGLKQGKPADFECGPWPALPFPTPVSILNS
jgi:hypothetical protein